MKEKSIKKQNRVFASISAVVSFLILILVGAGCKDETENSDVSMLSDLSFDLPDNVVLVMKKIPAGTFVMGSPVHELGRREAEFQHQVTLTNDFWLGQYEVTQAQYEGVMGQNPSTFQGDNLPVECVSWKDAVAYCKKLNEMFADRLPRGYAFALPTEAQWEYACRAGTTTALNSGKDLTCEIGSCPNLDEVGWYFKSSMSGGLTAFMVPRAYAPTDQLLGTLAHGGNRGIETHPVGQKKPNAWGLYDMHGNVWEWCLDIFDAYPDDNETDPQKIPSFQDKLFRTSLCHVARGGSWYFQAFYCRSAYRFNFEPDTSAFFLGFRVALSKVP